jgi:hypothetical protein
VRDTVREVLRRYKAAPEAPDPQIVLPGFERLQTGYLTERDGDQAIVPLSMMTTVELEAKAAELETMGMGCFQHAREIRRYIAQRPTTTSTAA